MERIQKHLRELCDGTRIESTEYFPPFTREVVERLSIAGIVFGRKNDLVDLASYFRSCMDHASRAGVPKSLVDSYSRFEPIAIMEEEGSWYIRFKNARYLAYGIPRHSNEEVDEVCDELEIPSLPFRSMYCYFGKILNCDTVSGGLRPLSELRFLEECDMEYDDEDGRFIPFLDEGNGDSIAFDNATDLVVRWNHETFEVEESALDLEGYFAKQLA